MPNDLKSKKDLISDAIITQIDCTKETFTNDKA